MKNRNFDRRKTNLFLLNFVWLLCLLFLFQNLNLSLIQKVNADEKREKLQQTDNVKKTFDVVKENNQVYNFGEFDNKVFFKSPNLKNNDKSKELENRINTLVGDYPIKEMSPYIEEYNSTVAGLIVGIAKKESNWGKHAPFKNGKICYNYWGYKGAGSRGSALGYGCFAIPEEAIQTIGNRIQELVEQGLITPAKMIVWKCGRSCAGHSDYSVKKWISDVDLYYNKIAIN